MKAWVLWLCLSAFASGPLVVGDHAAVFSLPSVTGGEKLGLADRVGLAPKNPAKALVLYFFTPEHGAEHVEALGELAGRYRAEGLQVVGVLSGVDEATSKRFAGSLPEGVEVVRDTYSVVTERYGLPGPPMVFVLDGQGVIHSIGVPEVQLADTLESRVRPLLDAP